MRAPSLTVGIEEEYQIIDPVTRDLTPGFDALVTSDDAQLADVKAELHQCQVEIGTKVCTSIAELRKRAHHAARPRDQGGGAARADDRGGRHASVLELDEPGDDAEGALPGRQGRVAGSRAPAAHLRDACARRDRGPRVPHRLPQCGALRAAAHPLPFHELAVLVRPQHGAAFVSQHRVQELPAHRRAANPAGLERLRRPGGHAGHARTASPTARRSGGTCARTTPIRRSSSASAT